MANFESKLMQRSAMVSVRTNATVLAPPPPCRFTLSEWYLSNRQRYRVAEDQQQLAEKIIAESERVCNETDVLTGVNKIEVDRRIAQRINDIEFKKSELTARKNQCCIEEEALVTYKERIQDVLAALKQTNERISVKCVTLRENRLGIDLVYDDVERELKKEGEIIHASQCLLQRTLEQANEEIRRLRSTKYFINRDLEDKGNALNIDSKCVNLQPTSLNLSLYDGFAPLDSGNVTKEEWESFSVKNIEKAAKELNSARTMRSYVDTLLKQAITDLWNQYNITNEAFRRRIGETREAKKKLEQEHYETVKKVNEMTNTVTKIKKAIAEKEGYMALAHTRLGNRSHRPAIELTRDEAETQLVVEVQNLKDNIIKLQDTMNEAQASLRYLLSIQLQLEEDINVKTNTLKIDEVDCMTIRQGMDYHTFSGKHYTPI